MVEAPWQQGVGTSTDHMAPNPSFRFLPLTLSTETVGGVASPLVLRGTPLPAQREQTFSTADDDQEAVSIKVFLGESPVAAKDIHLQTITLEGIPKSLRGEPAISVLFEVDRACSVKVSAKEKKSGKTISAVVEGAPALLSDELIKEMLERAASSAEEDKAVVRAIELRNNAEQTIHSAEKHLRQQRGFASLGSSSSEIEEVIAALGIALQDRDDEQIEARTKRLHTLIGAVRFPADFSDIFGSVFQTPQTMRGTKQHVAREDHKPDSETRGPSPSTDHATKHMAKSEKGLFGAGQFFDAKIVIRDLFVQAKSQIDIIDAYVGEDVLRLLTAKTTTVTVRILTSRVSPALLSLSRDFNKQYTGLQIRCAKDFHDRFVIVDNTDVYHFGASLEHLGNKMFMFSKLEEAVLVNKLREHWQAAWEKADVVV